MPHLAGKSICTSIITSMLHKALFPEELAFSHISAAEGKLHTLFGIIWRNKPILKGFPVGVGRLDAPSLQRALGVLESTAQMQQSVL